MRQVRWVVFVTAAAVLSLGLPRGARAQEGEAQEQPGGDVGASRGERARQLFEQGRLAYERGDFEEALERFRKAYELADLRARVLLLINIAQVLDRLDREEEALRYYERYLELAPDGPQAGVARGRVRVLRQRLGRREEVGTTRGRPGAQEAERQERQEGAEAEAPAAPARAEAEPAVGSPEEEAGGRTAERDVLGEPASPAEAEARQGGGWVWWVVGGAALVAGGVAAALLLGSGADEPPGGPVAFDVEALR